MTPTTPTTPTPRRAHLYEWSTMPADQPMDLITRSRIIGQHMMLSHVTLEKGFKLDVHQHDNEQLAVVLSGHMRFTLVDGADGTDSATRTIEMHAGQVLHLPPNVPHGAEAIETSVILDLFSPPSEKTGVDSPGSS